MKKYFEYHNNSENSHKFWQITLSSKNVEIKFGRVGIKNPATFIRSFKNSSEALKFANSKLKEKINKGYVLH